MSENDELDSPTSPGSTPGTEGKVKGRRPGKSDPGAQLRRDQNRIAQREFRLRKQQHIRDLEARIEILSGNREEHQELMSLLVRNLLAENAQLRKMIKGMAGFVGEGLATSLPRIGLTPESLEAFLSRPDTETAHEAYAALKEARKREESGDMKLGSGEGLGRGLDKDAASVKRKWGQDDGNGKGAEKRTRRESGQGGPGEMDMDGTSLVSVEERSQPNYWPQSSNLALSSGPSSSSGGPSGPFTTFMNPSAQASSSQQSALHRELLGDDPEVDNLLDPTMFVGMGLFPSKSPPQQIRASVAAPKFSSYPGQGIERPELRPAGADETSASAMAKKAKAEEMMEVLNNFMENSSGRMKEAMQLINYHMDNYSNDNSYHLPPSLVPTEVQKMIEHEHVIDAILNPRLREMMIFLRGKYDIMEAWKDLIECYEVRGEDTLDHNSWEMSESWLRKHSILVDTSLLAICNKWRAERGERQLTMEEIKSGAKPPK